MKILSLFAGIGGLELGLERAGLGRTCWQVEQDPFCRQVLARHWPDAERFDDVCAVTGADFPGCEIICGGFPCQDISLAGKGRGLDGERSGLWREFYRLICEIRPRLIIAENVPALVTRGLDRVLSDLAGAGYDAEWEIVSAADAGAPHLRKRIFLIAAHPDRLHLRHESEPRRQGSPRSGDSGAKGPTAHAVLKPGQDPADPRACAEFGRAVPEPRSAPGGHAARTYWAETESPVCGLDDGISGRVDRLRALGNAVVPQVAELVGRRALRVMEHGVSDEAWDLS